MTTLVVDFAQLQSAVRHMEQFGHDVTQILDDVNRAVAALRANWEGSASDAQAQAQQQWEDGADQMKTSLEQLQKVADTAHKNYTDAVNKNREMWAG